MVELVEEQIEYGRAFYYAAGMCCVAGGIAIFVYPEQGIGLIVFGGILLIWSLGNVAIAAIRNVSAKLTGIIDRLDAVERKN